MSHISLEFSPSATPRGTALTCRRLLWSAQITRINTSHSATHADREHKRWWLLNRLLAAILCVDSLATGTWRTFSGWQMLAMMAYVHWAQLNLVYRNTDKSSVGSCRLLTCESWCCKSSSLRSIFNSICGALLKLLKWFAHLVIWTKLCS